MPRNGSSSEGSSSSEDSSSDDDLLLSIPRPGVVLGEGVVGDSDDPFDSPSKVLFESCLGTTKMCGGAEASLQRQGGQQQHHREKETEREPPCSRVLTFVSWRTGCRALRWRPSGSTWGCASLRPSPQAPPGTARRTCLRTKQSLQKRRSFFCTARATRERERRWPSGRARCCQQAFAFVFFFSRAAANERTFRN